MAFNLFCLDTKSKCQYDNEAPSETVPYLVNNAVVVLHDERVSQPPQNVHFRDEKLLLVVPHRAVVDFFPGQYFAIRLAPHLAHDPKGSLVRGMRRMYVLEGGYAE